MRFYESDKHTTNNFGSLKDHAREVKRKVCPKVYRSGAADLSNGLLSRLSIVNGCMVGTARDNRYAPSEGMPVKVELIQVAPAAMVVPTGTTLNRSIVRSPQGRSGGATLVSDPSRTG
uniref:Uncharacterized protein n=1 Tax=Anopheles coluzzii TaxID=1518534 RepID=A0A8W7PN15_ANOCL